MSFIVIPDAETARALVSCREIASLIDLDIEIIIAASLIGELSRDVAFQSGCLLHAPFFAVRLPLAKPRFLYPVVHTEVLNYLRGPGLVRIIKGEAAVLLEHRPGAWSSGPRSAFPRVFSVRRGVAARVGALLGGTPPNNLGEIEPELTIAEKHAASRAVPTLLHKWGLSHAQAKAVLGGLDPSDLHEWASGRRAGAENLGVRLSLLIGIHRDLKMLFGDGDRRNAWIQLPSAEFMGRSPAQLFEEGDVRHLWQVRLRLSALLSQVSAPTTGE